MRIPPNSHRLSRAALKVRSLALAALIVAGHTFGWATFGVVGVRCVGRVEERMGKVAQGQRCGIFEVEILNAMGALGASSFSKASC